MARFSDVTKVYEAFQPELEEGEEIRHVGYGVKQPPIILIVALLLVGILPGVIAIALMTREYVVALTNRRFIALRFRSKAIRVQERMAWRLDSMPPVKASTGGLFTHIAIQDPAHPFVAKFHRLGMPGQREEMMAIESALSAA